MPCPIFGARARRTRTPLRSAEPRLTRYRRGLGFGSSRHACAGPHARTRRRSTLDPALTARRRHYARPGGRDEHLNGKWLVTKKAPPNANEKYSLRISHVSIEGTIALIDVTRLRSYAYSLSRRSTTPCSPRSHSGAHPSPFAHPRPARPVVRTTPPLAPVN